MQARRITIAVFLALLAVGSAFAEEVGVETNDGVHVAATYTAGAPGGAGVVLIPMLSRTRADWAATAKVLAAKGTHVLAIDLRGHGQSAGGPTGFKNFSDADWRKTDLDVDAAVAWLRAKPGVDEGRVGIMGASIGANAALIRCSKDPSIKAIVALSPGNSYHGVDAASAAPNCKAPVFLAASEGDAYSAASVRAMAKSAGGAQGVTHVFSGKAHGTNMLDTQKDLSELITTFLAQHL